MRRFTPGDFRFDGDEFILSENDDIIADIRPYDAAGEPLKRALINTNPEEARANGELLAMAPQMFRALSKIAQLKWPAGGTTEYLKEVYRLATTGLVGEAVETEERNELKPEIIAAYKKYAEIEAKVPVKEGQKLRSRSAAAKYRAFARLCEADNLNPELIAGDLACAKII